MKNIYAFVCGGVMLLSVAACAKAPSAEAQARDAAGGAPAPQARESAPARKGKTLVAYYSYSGNTKAVAEQIARLTGGDLFEINTVQTYPEAYNDLTAQAKKEINAGYKPELSGRVENMADYDRVFVGSPNWWGTYAPAVSSFLSQYDFTGKTVAPFFTHGGGGMQRCERDVKARLSGVNVTRGITFPGRSSGAPERELAAWLADIGLDK